MSRPELEFQLDSVALIKRKMAAYTELFGLDPLVEVRGTFDTVGGRFTESVFFDIRYHPVLEIGRHTLTCNVDGSKTKLRVTRSVDVRLL